MRMLLICVLSCVLLAGCSTIYKTVSIDSKPATSLDIDAKERMILVTDHGGKDGDRRVVCAEPSPDTAVGIAASTSIAANVKGQVDAKLATSLAEAVQSVGRRTQTIQLLRDGLYRACEAYLNGAISREEYRLLLARISAFSVTILAVDGLTGGQGVQATAIATKGNSKVGEGSPSPSGGANGVGSAAPTQSAQHGSEADVEAGTTGGGQPSTSDTKMPQENVNAVVAIVKEYYDLQRYIYNLDLQMAKLQNGMTANQGTPSEKVPNKP